MARHVGTCTQPTVDILTRYERQIIRRMVWHDSICRILQQRGCIQREQVESVKQIQVKGEKARAILEMVVHRFDELFRHFHDALIITKQTELAVILDPWKTPDYIRIGLLHTTRFGDCKICVSKQACIINLPCGHLTSCPDCSKYLDDATPERCVICRQQVYMKVTARPC